jgi:8-oxo-dGTP diphosphatase / 2-hydroxy-dATP diphosphatase
MKVIQTVVFIVQDEKVLLGLKKQGFGVGKWNGFGGKLNPGETLEECAKREVREEAMIEISDLEKFAVSEFHFGDQPKFYEVHHYVARSFEGEPQESDEMKPQWFSIYDMPYKDMWPDLAYWWEPYFLKGKKFKNYFLYTPDGHVIEKRIEEYGDLA